MKNFARFRNALEMGMGNDLRECFACKAALDVEEVNYLLDDETIPRPDIELLKRIVIASRGKISMDWLKRSLDYGTGPDASDRDQRGKKDLGERINLIIEDLNSGVRELMLEDVLWNSPKEVVSTLFALSCAEFVKDVSISGIAVDDIFHSAVCRAEYLLSCGKNPADPVFDVRHSFVLKLAKTSSGQYRLIGWTSECEQVEEVVNYPARLKTSDGA